MIVILAGGQRVAMTCRACWHEWEDYVPLPMMLTSFAKRMKLVECPACAANYKHIRASFSAPTQDAARGTP